MGLINLEPTLHPGEEIRWRGPAARSRENRTVPGLIIATNQAIVFMPNRLNRRRDLISWRLSWEQVQRIDTAGPERNLAARKTGGLRRRVRVVSVENETELFVVNQPEQVSIQLRRLAPGEPED